MKKLRGEKSQEIIYNILLNLIPEKKSVKSKRKIADWNEKYLIDILQKLPN